MARVVEQMLTLDLAGPYRMKAFALSFAADERERWHHRIRRHIGAMVRLSRIIRADEVHIVHIHTCSGFSFFRSAVDMLIAKRAGCAVVLHIHGAAFDEFVAGAGLLQRRFIAGVLALADRVVALSTGWRETLHEVAPNARVVVIENAVEAESASTPGNPRGLKPAARNKKTEDAPEPAVRNSREGDVTGSCRFLLLARMEAWKGIDDLLDACAHLRNEGVDFQLTLAGPAGTAGDATTLGEKIRDRGIEQFVRYVGAVQGEEKRDLLLSADVYVQPSHNEGLPIAMLEAMAFGLPVVATRVGAIPEVITDQDEGLLVPARRPKQLASAMRALAMDQGRRVRMGAAARTLADTRFSLDRFERDLNALYEDVTTSSKRIPHV